MGKNLNPMFNAPTKPKPIYEVKEKRPRKTRCDKKHDIKVPVTEIQKMKIRLQAHRKGLRATPYSSNLVIEGLKREFITDIGEFTPYKDTHDYVHVKLLPYHYEKIVELAIKWGVSERRAAHRILLFMVKWEEGE